MKVIYTKKREKIFVDDEDYEWLNQYTWHLDPNGYATRGCKLSDGRSSKILMHRQIMNTPKDMITDHINHKQNDNQKSNLRVCSHGDNQKNRNIASNNTSGVIGVSFDNHCQRWVAEIQVSKKSIHLGYFENIEDAVLSRKEAEIKYFKDYRNKEPTTNAEHLKSSKLKETSKLTKCKSGIRGVTWSHRRNRWEVSISINKKFIWIGAFLDFEDAKKARKSAEIERDRILETGEFDQIPLVRQKICGEKVRSTNTSGVNGVSWDESTHKWKSSIQIDGKKIYLGCYDDIENAKTARKEAETKYLVSKITDGSSC